MADTLLLYGGNGERLRPEQGYPLRVLIPAGRATCRSNGCDLVVGVHLGNA
jgi:Oxidoreductase molybdopterin binding domain